MLSLFSHTLNALTDQAKSFIDSIEGSEISKSINFEEEEKFRVSKIVGGSKVEFVSHFSIQNNIGHTICIQREIRSNKSNQSLTIEDG